VQLKQFREQNHVDDSPSIAVRQLHTVAVVDDTVHRSSPQAGMRCKPSKVSFFLPCLALRLVRESFERCGGCSRWFLCVRCYFRPRRPAEVRWKLVLHLRRTHSVSYRHWLVMREGRKRDREALAPAEPATDVALSRALVPRSPSRSRLGRHNVAKQARFGGNTEVRSLKYSFAMPTVRKVRFRFESVHRALAGTDEDATPLRRSSRILSARRFD
jgi:hypothetical protein